MKYFVNNEKSFLLDVCFNVIIMIFQSDGVHIQKLRIYSKMFPNSCDEYISTSKVLKLME